MLEVFRAEAKGHGDEERDALKNRYKDKKRILKRHILTSKRVIWKEACDDLEDDIWGNGYKIAAGLFRTPSPVDLTQATATGISHALFPRVIDETPTIPDEEAEQHMDPFTMEEMISTAERLKSGKVSGLDGISPEAA
ncbi:hypothetical protein JTB14_028330 [Gonioctena quinquepunctata]|nr:hypothetical protein JTB14_028330 [Gonioctena quinquepunctata]